jgi:uncharacterized protein
MGPRAGWRTVAVAPKDEVVMSRPDKAVEPSMEEILASIRKIISEEPIGTRPSASDAQAPVGEFGRYEPGADPEVPSLQPVPRRAEAVGLDDILGLAQGSAADFPGGDAGRQAGLAKPAAAEPRVSPPAADGGSPAANGVVPASHGGPDTAKPSGSTSAREANGLAGAHETAAPASLPSDDAAKAPRPSVDADAALSEARARIERHLGTPPKVDAAPLPGLKSIRDMEFRGNKPRPDSESTQSSVAGGLMARVKAAGARPEAAPAGNAAQAQTAPAQRSAAGSPASTGADTASDNAAEVPIPVRQEPARQPAPGASAVAADAARPQHVAQRPAQAVPTAVGPASSERPRGLEDAVAEMLRPMLREWLDANLPRLVQQALREEMAKSPLPGKDDRGS